MLDWRGIKEMSWHEAKSNKELLNKHEYNILNISLKTIFMSRDDTAKHTTWKAKNKVLTILTISIDCY